MIYVVEMIQTELLYYIILLETNKNNLLRKTYLT